MADILEYDAAATEARFDELLDQIERGCMVRITRDGRLIARLVPETEAGEAEVPEVIERLKALREQVGKAPLDEAPASIHEGHKH
jgi:antitoxin (DNA-binding transcriptional repressor) of toxin-antitoxin stability system